MEMPNRFLVLGTLSVCGRHVDGKAGEVRVCVLVVILWSTCLQASQTFLEFLPPRKLPKTFLEGGQVGKGVGWKKGPKERAVGRDQ